MCNASFQQLTFPCRCKNAIVRPAAIRSASWTLMIPRRIDLSPTSAFCQRLSRNWSIADSPRISADTACFRFTSELTAPNTRQRQQLSAYTTRHRASTSMYSLTFCVRFLLPECHQRNPAVQVAAVMLRTPPVTRQSAARSARRPRPAGRSHYVVISRDGRKLVTRVRVMLP